jgi:O-succinylbenzoic acid--CoA ligase
VVHTSGSTGIPKEITIPKEWMKRSAELTCEYLSLRTGMKALLCIPSRYIGGMMMIVRSMEVGMQLHITEPKLRVEIPRDIDFIAMIPSQVENFVNGSETFSRSTSIIIGGAPISKGLEKRLLDVPGKLYATFGMTESVSHIALKRMNGPKATDYFEALGNISISSDSQGKMAIQIPHFDNLILQTNDIISRKDDGHFKWLGRADNVINSGGLKIHPEEIESRLSEYIDPPFIITYQNDRILGERVILVIESEKTLNMDDALSKAIQELGNKGPRSIYVTSSFKRSPSGKVIRNLDSMDLHELRIS